MRAFLISLTLFVLLCGFVVTNSLLVQHAANELEAALCDMVTLQKGDGDDAFAKATAQSEAFLALWEQKSALIRLGVSEEELIPITQAIAQMKSYAKSGVAEEYEMCRAVIWQGLSRIKELESPSFHTVF